MGIVTILPETTQKPITLMGERSGICWGSNTTNDSKNFKRGLDCLDSGHGRVLEFVNAEMILDGYSARVIREWYTHIGGSPTRLQASTRYIDYSKDGFSYITPISIKKNDKAYEAWVGLMLNIRDTCQLLENTYNIPKEDVANALPLGMTTKIVDKRNLRNLIDMSHQRMCNRAYWEFRELFKDVTDALSSYSWEWDYIISHYFMPKCDVTGYCTEKNSCGRRSRPIKPS